MSRHSKQRIFRLAFVFSCIAAYVAILRFFPDKADRSAVIGVALVFWLLATVGICIFGWKAMRDGLKFFLGKRQSTKSDCHEMTKKRD
jgi:hypothetical protein